MTQTALVTGGQQGIGLGVAQHLKQAGFQVAIASELDPDAPVVTAALKDLGQGARYFRHDVSEIAHVPALLDQVEKAFGPITTLISNAGIGAPQRGDMLELKPENWDIVQDINLRGAFFLAQGVAKRMLSRKADAYRSMIFVTSVSAAMASPERAEYCVSKAGAAMMAQLFALRLAAHGIGVFDLRPGIITSDLTAGVREMYTARIEDGLVPARRWGEPQDIGQIATAAATGQMKFATGAAIPVDGGLSIPRL